MEGGCTCRQVRYRLVGMPFVHACHCRWCQGETGTAHALNALYEADRVVHTAGEPELVWTPSASGKGQKIARCPTCPMRFGVTTRKPVPPFGSSASVPWTQPAAGGDQARRHLERPLCCRRERSAR